MDDTIGIRRAQSCARDARQAVREFHTAVSQKEMALVIFFCSCEYDLDELAEEMDSLFTGVPVVGCAAAGEIGPAGYLSHSLTGVSFSSSNFVAAVGRLDGLRQFEISSVRLLVQDLLRDLEGRSPLANPDNTFALQLLDGLSVHEEPVTRVLQHELDKVPLVGGSAGDGLSPDNTRIFHDGRFHSDCAVLALVSTPLPFKPFMTHHFVAAEQRMVVTSADPKRRLVHEIDGRPAALAYAELVGADVADLGPLHFATSPIVVVIGGVSYARSIGEARPDGSLKFFCAIDEGMVLRIARGTDLVENLRRVFAGITDEIGQPQVVISSDCILRRLEIVHNKLQGEVAEILERNRVIGFNSYGEQYRGVHVNQTITGIAIGAADVGS